ncbi:MAG: hypothetical protein JWM40_648, partial [Frankiales bacterium]|nr:hypothetical protein [Frankiales bacterium]
RGYGRTLTLADGTHTVCVTFVNVGEGSTQPAICQDVLVRHLPLGPPPSFKRVPGGLVVYGWALDLDTTQPISAKVLVDGVAGSPVEASVARTDVAAAYPGYGAPHGFATAPLDLKAGVHKVCVTGINATGSTGADTVLGCANVTISHNPVGSVPAVVVRSTGVTVSGWAIDQDSAKPVSVLLLLDGHGAARLTANLARPDLAARYGAYGTAHGWSKLLRPPHGTHTVCLRADNLAGTAGTASSLGCKTFRS